MSEITPNTPNPVREDAYKQQLAAKLGIDPQYIPGSPIWHSEEEIAAIAEMFSNMAGSSGGGVLVVNETISEGTHTLDKTWKEISDAANAGTIIYYIIQSGGDEGTIMYATRIVYDGVAYCADFSKTGGNPYVFFESETENGYPSYTRT